SPQRKIMGRRLVAGGSNEPPRSGSDPPRCPLTSPDPVRGHDVHRKLGLAVSRRAIEAALRSLAADQHVLLRANRERDRKAAGALKQTDYIELKARGRNRERQ